MTPRTLRSTVSLWFAALAMAVLAAGRLATPAAAQSGPVTLAGNADLQSDRLQLIREEFRERQHEIRESFERARRARHGRGIKAEQAARDIDLAGGAAAAHARAAGPFGSMQSLATPTNTRANDKTLDVAGAGQAEQSIAFLGLNGLCAWNDGQGFNLTPQDVQGYGWTNNGGATWTDGGIPLKAGTIATWTSDPVVAVNEKTGDFYYNGLTTNTGTNNNGVAVARGHFTAGVFGWDAAVVVASGPSASQAFDKQWVVADSSNGNVYVSWTLFTATGSSIFFSRSTDNGATWSAPVQINGSWENGRVSGSRPMVGPNGEVYVQYTAIGPVDADSIKIAKSTNAGASFAPAVVATTIFDNFFTGCPGFNRPRAVTFASGAVDRTTGPRRGRVYMTIQDCVNFFYDPLGGVSNKSEVENNGNVANATPFTVGQTLRGSISSTTDQDWWSFPATQGTTYIFFVDSLRTTSFRYTLRMYCPNDTIALSRIAFSGAQSTTSALNSHSLIVWTAPSTNTYYLRMVPVSVGSGANNYRIQTGVHTASITDVARDTRDVVLASSADGVTGWSPRARVNDDAPLYDNWLPEVAVPCDGNPYVMWFDWRDTPASCFGGSNIYTTRSTDGGATWAASQVVTTAVTANWTQVSSNIAPNTGDYNGFHGGDAIGFAFADGRLGDPDVFTARVPAGFSLSGCPGDQTIVAGQSLGGLINVSNLNGMFGNNYTWTLTVNRNWPGFPASGSASAAAGGATNIPVSVLVPDSAAHNELVTACLTVKCANGDCSQSCCFTIKVDNSITPTLASLASSTAEPGRVRLSWLVSGRTPANVYRSVDGVTWANVGTVDPTGDGYVNFEDTNVSMGARYAYRLGLTVAGREVFAGQSWIDVPVVAEFAIGRVFPSPAKAGFSVSFSLSSAAPATLEVIDLAGRRVVSRQVGTMGVGRHTLSLESETGRLPIGVYGVRLTQGSKVATSKVTVVR